MLLVTLLTACAPRLPPLTLGVPVSPTEGSIGRSSYSVGTTLPRRAPVDGEWVASDPHATCKVAAHEVLNVSYVIPSAAEWPYSLPASVTCTNGDHVLSVPVAWTPPAGRYRVAADGTFVLPMPRGVTVAVEVDAPQGLADATIEPPVQGVHCAKTQGGALAWRVDRSTTANGGTCRLTMANGTTEDRNLVILAY